MKQRAAMTFVYGLFVFAAWLVCSLGVVVYASVALTGVGLWAVFGAFAAAMFGLGWITITAGAGEVIRGLEEAEKARKEAEAPR